MFGGLYKTSESMLPVWIREHFALQSKNSVCAFQISYKLLSITFTLEDSWTKQYSSISISSITKGDIYHVHATFCHGSELIWNNTFNWSIILLTICTYCVFTSYGRQNNVWHETPVKKACYYLDTVLHDVWREVSSPKLQCSCYLCPWIHSHLIASAIKLFSQHITQFMRLH